MRTLASIAGMAFLFLASAHAGAIAPPSAPCGAFVPLTPAAITDLALPIGPDPLYGECVGKIQPGAQLWSGCTANWVVRDETGALYIGTAGHCVGGVGQRQGMRGVGDFGAVAFGISGGQGTDYALIRIDPAFYDRVDPTLCHWGGPTGVAIFPDVTPPPGTLPSWLGGGANPTPPRPVLHYGWGIVTNEHAETRARVQLNLLAGPNYLTELGNVNPGDSGSPIMFADGSVAGVITHSFLVDPPATPDSPAGPGTDVPPVGAGVGIATRIDRAFALAHAGTGHTFTLVTSGLPVLTGDLPAGP